MSAFPLLGDLNGSSPGHNTGVQQAALTALHAAVTGLLGSDGAPLTARGALGIALPNYLDNPNGEVYQRTVAATSDDVYMDDRWYALTQTASVTPSKLAYPEDGFRAGLRLTQHQVASQRMGRAQIIEGSRASDLRGRTVSAGGRFKFSSTQAIRLAILAWTGTEDVVTSDVVSNWGSGTYTPGNFFNATTLSLVGSASFALTAGVTATCGVSGVVPSAATNLIYLYWTEAVAATGLTMDAWDQRLVDCPVLVDCIRRSPEEELRACRRFLPAYNGVFLFPGACYTGSSIAASGAMPFDTSTRIAPTGIQISSAGHFRYSNASNNYVASAVSFLSASVTSGQVLLTVSGVAGGNLPGVVDCNNAGGQILFTGVDL